MKAGGQYSECKYMGRGGGGGMKSKRSSPGTPLFPHAHKDMHTRTQRVWYNSIDASKSWWGTFPTARARNLVSHYMVNYILQNMSKDYRFGTTSTVPPLQQGTYHA